MAKPALGVGLVAPRDAAAHFAKKNLLLPSFNWDDVYAQEHAAGVAVAGITQRNVLQLFADEIQRTIDAGGDLREFKRRLRPALAKAGFWGDVEVTDPATGDKRITKFNDNRLDLIFATNTRQAFAAGQYQRALAAKGALPYLVYLSSNDDKVRPQHRAWHGTVLPVEHVFWHTHFPPCGWRCRCKVVSLDEDGVKRYAARGVPIKRQPPPGADQLVPYTRKGTGEVVMVPRGIDPGFDHNPGLARLRGVLPHLVDDVSDPQALSAWVRAFDTPTPTRIAKAQAATTPELLGGSDEVIINALLSEFGAGIGRPAVFVGPAGLPQVVADELFKSRRNGKEEWKIRKLGRDEWLPLIIKTLKDPDQIRTLFPRDKRGNVRVRQFSQFVVGGEGEQSVSVLVVWEWDKTDLRLDVLVGKSAHTTDAGNDAAKMQKEFIEGQAVLYDRRYGVVQEAPPKKMTR